MDYNTPLIEGQFLKRYKRFFADVRIGNKVEVAHVPNTGSLIGLCDTPHPCRVSPSTNPERKLKFTLEQIQTDTSWVGVNTHRANDLAFEAFNSKLVTHWHNYNTCSREVKINAETRLDLKLSSNIQNSAPRFIEVKSVTLARSQSTEKSSEIEKTALFPDAVTTRGQKHLTELMRLQSQGLQTELLFVVQRNDCCSFAPAVDIDAAYARLLRMAADSGVKLTAYPVTMSERHILLDSKNEIPIIIS